MRFCFLIQKDHFMPDRVALFLQDDFSLQESIEYVKYAEARGFEAVWQAETGFSRDSVIAMAAYAAVTTRINIGSAVMNIYTRHTATIASEFLTLDDIAPDRMICGLGTWHDGLSHKVGINRGKHMLALREVVTSLRQLLLMQRVIYRGQFVQIDDIQLTSTSGRNEARRIPIYVGATGPKLLALAGDIADGVLLNYMVSPKYNNMAIGQLEIGLKQSGRAIYDIDRPQLIMCSVHHDRKIALDAARKVVTQFIAQQPQLMRANGIPQYLIAEITQLRPVHEQQIEQASRLVSDDIVQMVTASGTPADVRAKVRDYIRTGATCPVLYPLNRNVRSLIDAFASGYSE